MNTSLVLCIERRPKGLGEDMRSPQLNGGERKVKGKYTLAFPPFRLRS